MTRKMMNFRFGLEEWWKEKLPKTQANYLKQHHEQSFEAMNTIMGMLETEWDSKVTRSPICIETHPFAQIPMRKYLMASEEEFQHLLQNNRDLIVRRLSEQEMLHLTQQEEELQ